MSMNKKYIFYNAFLEYENFVASSLTLVSKVRSSVYKFLLCMLQPKKCNVTIVYYY